MPSEPTQVIYGICEKQYGPHIFISCPQTEDYWCKYVKYKEKYKHHGLPIRDYASYEAHLQRCHKSRYAEEVSPWAHPEHRVLQQHDMGEDSQDCVCEAQHTENGRV